MSRHPSPSDVEPPYLAEDYIHYVCSNAVPKAMTLEELKQQTKKDAEMRALITAIETDQWNSQEVQGYKRLKDEFSVHNGLVLRRNRIVIPATVRNKAVDLAHLGHHGIVKTKQLIRDKVGFPGIDKMTEETIQNCLPCQVATAKSPRP